MLGAAFHLFMEGKGRNEVAAEFPGQVEEAERLANLRRTRGPPLPKQAIVEQEFTIFDGKMTSKPDRIETVQGKPIVRDFKTAAFFSERDNESWNVDVGILGECIAAETDTALVDITVKRENPAGQPVKVVKVTLTPAKAVAVKQLVDDFWQQLEARLTELAKRWRPDESVPRNPAACVGKYGSCPYYARCWGQMPQPLLYQLTPTPPDRWVDFSQGPQPREWKVRGKSVLEALQSEDARKKLAL